MATYKEIKGLTVQTKDSDPVTNTGSWASGNNTNSPHAGYGGSSGTYNAALVASEGPYGDKVELYDGTSWSETGDLSTARQSAYSAGTQPATWLAGGRTGPSGSTNNTETFNGSSWTEVNEMNTTRFSSGSTGTYTAGIAVAGNTFTDISRAVETWNGTSWSTHPNDYDSDVAEVITFGTTTAAIMAGGFDGPAPRGGSNNAIATSYSYDGSTYTAITAMPQTLNSTTGMGSQTDGLIAGGDRYPSPNTANTLSWNGTAWSQVQDVPVSAYGWGASKATTDTKNQVIFCGSPGQNTTTVDWAFPPPTAAILKEGMIFLSGGTTLKGFGKAAGVPAGTWSSGGALNTARGQAGAAGVSQDSAMVSAGRDSPPTAGTNVCEQYNGSSWTEVADTNTSRSALSGGGTQTANFIAGGRQAPPSGLGNTEIWNGSGWTEVSDLNTGRAYVTGNGTQTAGMIAGGGPPTTGKVELWDGSSWTETTDLNTAKIYRSLFGGSATTTASVCVGGENPQVGNSETWNGSSWTEGNDLNTARGSSGVAGVSTFGLVFGGQYDSGYYAQTEVYNGTSYTELADLSTANGYTVPANNSPNVSALAAGGFTPSVGTATEEWTATAALSTITVS